MLKKEYRLVKNTAFTATFKNRNIVSDSCAVVYKGKLKTNERAVTKVGFVVSKKIHKRAVKRNRVKRLYREAYRIALKNNAISNSQKYMSIIFVIKVKALELDFQTCYKAVLELLNK